MPRKRARDETAAAATGAPAGDPTDASRSAIELEHDDDNSTKLQKLRNTWEFACLVQFLFLFGKTLKLQNVDLDDFEMTCIGPDRTEKLTDIGVALLKFITGTKTISRDQFESQAQKQYTLWAASRNPFSPSPPKPEAKGGGRSDKSEAEAVTNGVDAVDSIVPFSKFDLFEQIRILHQLSVWTFVAPERIRNGSQVTDQTEWRIEPFGWDGQDRSYFLLDDDRLYRMSSKSKAAKTKGKGKAKKRRVSTRGDDLGADPEEADNGFGGRGWECIAISLDDYQKVIQSLDDQGDPNEKVLLDRIKDDLLPVIEKKEADRRRLELKKLRDLETQQRMLTAKRSSRLAERRRRDEEQAEAERADDEPATATVPAKAGSGPASAPPAQPRTREQRRRNRYDRVRQLNRDLAELDREAESGTRVSRRQLDQRRQKIDSSVPWKLDCECEVGSLDGDDDGGVDGEDDIVSCSSCRVYQHAECVDATADPDAPYVCSLCRSFEAEALKWSDRNGSDETGPKPAGRPRKIPVLDQGMMPEVRSLVSTPAGRSVSAMSVSAPFFPPPSDPAVSTVPTKHTPQSDRLHRDSPTVHQPGSAVSVSVAVPMFQKPAESQPKPAPVKHVVPRNRLPLPPLQLSPSLSNRSRSPVSPSFATHNLSAGFSPGLSPTLPVHRGFSPAKARVASMPLPFIDSPGLVPPLTLRPSPTHHHGHVNSSAGGGRRRSRRTSMSPSPSPSSPSSPVSPTIALGPSVHGLLPPSSAGISPRKVSSPPHPAAGSAGPPGHISCSPNLHNLVGSPTLLPAQFPRPAAMAGRSVSVGGALGSVSDIDPSGLPAILSSSPLGKSPVKHAVVSGAESGRIASPSLSVVVPRAGHRR